MCGINAIVPLTVDCDDRDIISEGLQMNKIIAHRGPDFNDYTCLKNGVFLGHTRLSIIDLSDSGNQPMTKHGYTITFNGEIYNYIEIREELINLGYNFKSGSDTEVILSAFHMWREKCLSKFNGMWSFILYDSECDRIFLSRDRFGKKPLYCLNFKNKYYFTSELKAFKAVQNFEFRLNKSVAFEYLKFGYEDRTNQTFVEDISCFPPGNYGWINLNQEKTLTYKSYYDINDSQPLSAKDLTFSEAKNKIESLVFDSIELRLRADVQVATALSGGLDSSIITLCAQKLLEQNVDSKKLHTFSSLFTLPEYNDVNEEKYALAVIKMANLKSTIIKPENEDFINSLDKLIYHHDEPFISGGMFAQYKIFEAMREENIKVSLDGQGVDEAIGGYGDYNIIYLRQLSTNKDPRFFREAISFINLYPQVFKSFLKSKNNATSDIKWVNEDYFSEINIDEIYKGKYGVKNASLYQIKSLFLPAYLQHQDRNSMAFGVESRSPFLDYRVVEFLMNIPDEYKIRNGVRKYILREAFKDLLPYEVYSRITKLGFPTPVNIWMTNEPYLYKELLADAGEMPFFTQDLTKLFLAQPKVNYKDYLAILRAIIISKWVKIFDVKLY